MENDSQNSTIFALKYNLHFCIIQKLLSVNMSQIEMYFVKTYLNLRDIFSETKANIILYAFAYIPEVYNYNIGGKIL